MSMNGTYILDANVIISLYNTRKQTGISKFLEAADSIKLSKRLVTSNVVFNELKLPPPALNVLRQIFRTFPVRHSDIDELKAAKDPRKIPQDPDLSLVALAEKIKNTQPNPIVIVTNDYKLSQFIRKYTPKFAVLPPSSFWLSFTNNLTNPNLKQFFRKIRKEITQYEFEYILERRDVYNPREKLNWIIEKAINVAQSSSIGETEVSVTATSDEDWNEKLKILNKYINGDRLEANENKLIHNFLPYTGSLIESNKSLNILLESSMADINIIKEKLLKDFKLSQCSLDYDEKVMFQSIITKKIATYEFLTAIILLESSEFEEAFTHFDYSAMYSTLASIKNGDGMPVIKTMYLKALSYLHNDLYRQAEEEFAYTQKLAEAYKNNKYLIISMTGQSICKYLQGDIQGSKDLILNVSKLVSKDQLNNLYMLYEFAENIYFLDRPVIAIHFYDEAMEIASELNKKVLVDKIKDRLKRCFYAVGQYVSPEQASIAEIIDLLHEQTKDELYNLAQAEIFGELNKKLNEEFPFITKNKWIKGNALDKALREPLDLVSSDIEEISAVNIDMGVELAQCGIPCFPEEAIKKGKGNKTTKPKKKKKKNQVIDEITITEVHPEQAEKTTILFTLSNKLGGIAFRIPEEIKIKIPELYTIRMKSDAIYMIEESQQLDKDRFYMRAIVHVKSRDDLIIEKHMHKVYGIYFEN